MRGITMATSSSRLHAILVCCFIVVARLACAALVVAAALVPAPPVALPLIGAVCIACPLAVRDDLRRSIAVLRDPRPAPLGRRHLARLRRQLERLPETEHPLGR
jgi:hypothetical protein